MEIIQEESESNGKLIAMDQGNQIGELTYSVNQDFIIADHTGINEDYKGKGVGKELFLALVEHLRQNSRKVMPLCPFVKAMFKRHTNMHDVLRHQSL